MDAGWRVDRGREGGGEGGREGGTGRGRDGGRDKEREGGREGENEGCREERGKARYLTLVLCGCEEHISAVAYEVLQLPYLVQYRRCG